MTADLWALLAAMLLAVVLDREDPGRRTGSGLSSCHNWQLDSSP
jgi:hypothetical protein